MLYQSSRAILFIVIFISLQVLLFKCGILGIQKYTYKSKEHYRWKIIKKKPLILTCVFSLIIFLVLGYRFEGYFLTFDNLESSLKYSIVDYNKNEYHIVDADDCYFLYSDDGYYYTAYKKDGRVGVVDFFSLDCQYNLGCFRISDEDLYITNVRAVYNKQADKTCYFVKNRLDRNQIDEYIIELDGEQMECIEYKKDDYQMYQIVKDGYFEEPLTITVNGVNMSMDSQFKLPF